VAAIEEEAMGTADEEDMAEVDMDSLTDAVMRKAEVAQEVVQAEDFRTTEANKANGVNEVARDLAMGTSSTINHQTRLRPTCTREPT
jgi:rRNA maturation endonuclease Nob1